VTRNRLVVALVIVAIAGAGGAWLAAREHHHHLVKRTDEQGKVYWTCPMHPQVRQDHPGSCPICGMKLVKKEEGAATEKKGEGGVLYWYDPMKPEAHFDKPGKSPFMDMELVPKRTSEGGDADGIVEIDPRMVQNLGIRTAKVERGTFFQRIDAAGSVDVDERRIVAIESRAAGWVEDLQVRAVGEPVKRGQRIAGVYSPDLFAAQQELALAARSKDEALISATRQRVALLGISPAQVESVLRSGKPERQVVVVASTDGVVTELNVRQGQQVMPGAPLMRVADLSQIWVTVEIPEAQGGWIAQGRAAEARLSAIPGKVFKGKVEYVYPSLETQTRTLRARISFPNPEGALRPGMFAEVALFGGPRDKTLLVPTEAVIRTGERDVVILAEGEGRFRPAMVKVGDDRAGHTEILEGLDEGETIVVSGQFLIDSEANLRGALARMSGSEGRLTDGSQTEDSQ
jgi:Cu(I)/Ag(I) efflux system membrane fusion protein